MRKIATLFLFLIPLFSYSQNISVANVSAAEGNGGQRTIDVMVVLSPAPAGPVDITYSTRNGSAAAGSDYAGANGTIHFNQGETMKRIPVTINGDATCESNESFDIVLSNPVGATLTDGVGTITIVDDDCMVAGRINRAKYEIRLTCTGYTTFSTGPPDCPIRSNGKVVLYGIVEGNEHVATDDDIMYMGTLQLDMDMDICSVKGEGDQAKHCGMTLNGSGPVDVELEVYFDQRGGYIKFENKTGRFVRTIKGSCEQAEMDEELTMIPNKTIASIFNGLEISTLTNRTLTVGTYREGSVSVSGLELVIEVIRKIR